MEERVKNNSKKLKQGAFILFGILLFTPFFQKTFKIYKTKHLIGETSISDVMPVCSIDSWISGEYQENYEKYFNENIGFRDLFVRLQNQINYSVFNEAKIHGIVVGKEGYLYLQSYIDGYTGADFSGEEYINIQAQKAKLVQEELKKKNIDLVFVFAPGKASFYSEYIPEKLKSKFLETNYECYKKYFNALGINFLDLKDYFLKIKNTAIHPLYPQYGVHWTDYGAVIAADSTIKYLEKLRNIKMNHFKISSINNVDGYSGYNDAADLLNLYTLFPKNSFSIPKLIFENDSTKTKPNVLTISDSYYWAFIDNEIPQNIFNEWHYWFQKKIYPESHVKTIGVEEVDLQSYIEKQNIIIVMGTEATLNAFPYSFVDNAWEIYAPKDKIYYSLKKKQNKLLFDKIVAGMRSNKTLMKSITAKASAQNTTVEQSLFNDAYWMYNIEINKKW